MAGIPVFVAACGGATPLDETNSAPFSIQIASGDGQSGPISTQLGSALMVRVSNSDGDPLAGVTVQWSVFSGNGTTGSATSVTDAAGMAENTYTLGSIPGENRVRAVVSGVQNLEVAFTATGLEPLADPPEATSIQLVSGDMQTATAGSQLTDPLVVRLFSDDNQPVAGTVVSWTVLTGGGSLGAGVVTSDGSGFASNTYTTGTTPGENTIQAAIGDQAAITAVFTATGQSAANALVTVGDNFFDPTAVAVLAGQDVQWSWNGNNPHNVTFADTSIQSSATQNSGTFRHTFPAAGTFGYHCTIHGAAQMSGEVTVN